MPHTLSSDFSLGCLITINARFEERAPVDKPVAQTASKEQDVDLGQRLACRTMLRLVSAATGVPQAAGPLRLAPDHARGA
jgi:hypothetical protein